MTVLFILASVRNSAGVVVALHASQRTDVLNTLSGASVNNSCPPLSRRYDNRQSCTQALSSSSSGRGSTEVKKIHHEEIRAVSAAQTGSLLVSTIETIFRV